MSLSFHVYSNNHAGGAIDYATIIATTASLTYSPAALLASSDNSFGVRAFDTVSTLEEQNVDAVVRIILDASQVDITNRPPPPVGLTARATANGGCRVDWSYPPVSVVSQRPTSFKVYLTAGATLSYASVAATVTYVLGKLTFTAQLTGLGDEAEYSVGVRAANAVATEPNTVSAIVYGEVYPPGNVDGLTAATAP